MRILVTGGTGFIGRNLTDRLLARGHELFCLVRETSDTAPLEKPGITLVTADLADEEGLRGVFDRVRPEAVFHCAAEVTSGNVEQLYKANVEGTFNVCNACLRSGVKRLVYASSVSVVSGNEEVPLTDKLPYKASNAYGWSKIESETVAVDFRSKGLGVAIIRPCMVYGEDEPHLLGRILGLVRKRRFPVLDVPGMDSLLNLVDVGNVVQALELALEKEEALTGTFIIADREVITLRKFLEVLYDEMGTRAPVVPSWLAKALMSAPPLRRRAKKLFKHRVYDISRAEKLLGYRPAASTEEGLRRTVRHWKEKHV